MTTLDEHEAWAEIAREFDKGRDKRSYAITHAGLCYAVDVFELNKRISPAIYTRMHKKIQQEQDKSNPPKFFLFPLTDEGAAQRAALARRFAEESKEARI